MDLLLYPRRCYLFALQNLSISNLTETKAVTEFHLEPTVQRSADMLQRQISTDS